MCIHRRSFLHAVLQNSCLNRQQRRIKATTVNRTASWPWSQTAQTTRQVLLRLQVKQKRLSGNASSDLEFIANNTAAAAPIYVASSSESEEQDNQFSRLPLLSDGASSDFEIIASTSAGASIYVSSSSESQDQDGEASKWPCLSDVASSDYEIMPSTAAGAPIYVSSSSQSDDQDSAALVPGRNLTPSDFKSYWQAWENSLPRPLPSSWVRTNWREQESACPLPPTEKPRRGSCVSTVCLFL